MKTIACRTSRTTAGDHYTLPPNSCRALWLCFATLIWAGALRSVGLATTQLEAGLSGPNASLVWNSVPGNTYHVQSRDSLTAGSWITNATVIAEGNMASWTEPASLASARFYRLLMPNGEQTLYEFPPELPPALPAFTDRTPLGESEIWWFSLAPKGDRGDLNGFSGEFTLSSVDLHIPGRGLDFIWARKYRSRLGPDTAQGNGWDFSYDIFVRRVGSQMEVHDGNSRRDIFLLHSNGTYVCDGFFREGSISNNAFTLTFADTGTWEFHPFDHPTAAGKIRRSTDRNGNAMNFQYDGLGRLARVVDTLGRTNTVSYDGNGFISTVTDFSGRQARYEYYGPADPDGSPGDLKLAVSPVVTNTPNANDFPGGKTNRYTYSKGLTPDALNHNLLTVTDAKGQTWLSNQYSATVAATNLNYDRVEVESLGFTFDKLKLEYLEQTPGAANNGAKKKTIVNDRNGNVREYYYDALNRLVMKREFTGRADPTQPTTETLNRPGSPLRPDDPPFFETRIHWNADSLPTEFLHPNSNVTQCVYERDLNPNVPARLRGNLREAHRLPGPLGGDQTELVDLFEYSPGFGSEILYASEVQITHGDVRECMQIPIMNLRHDLGPGNVLSGNRGGGDVFGTIDPQITAGDARECMQIPIQCSVNPAQPGGRLGVLTCGPGVDPTDDQTLWESSLRPGGSFVTQHADARSNLAQYTYDSRGNRIHATNRIVTVIEDWEYKRR